MTDFRRRYGFDTKALEQYNNIIKDFISDNNVNRLGSRLGRWAVSNNRDPRTIYNHQMKILKRYR